jgi:hypothetical protein
MLRRRNAAAAEPRRGVILLVVLFLLTLFAIVGITFVLHSDAEARAARAYRDGQFPDLADVEPELLFSYFLGQLLYDVPDDERGVYSGLRGHSLARNMFGLNYTLAPNGSMQLGLNDALAKLEAEHGGHPEVEALLDFVGSSRRGITR